MGALGGAIGNFLGNMIPFFRKGGKVRKMANGGAVLDAQDKMAIKALNTLIPMSKMKKGGKAKRKPRK
jgi:hypothetical protein